jgi:hypothetical protein
MLIHDDLTFRVLQKGSKDEKKNDTKKEKKKTYEGPKPWSYFLTLMALHMNSLTPKQIIFY